MNQYAVGQVLPELAIGNDGIFFQVDNSGCSAIFEMNHPSQQEIDQFKAEKPFEIRMTPLDGIIMMTFKVGNMPWTDAPFSAHLAPNLDLPDEIPEGSGLALTVMVVDSSNGTIKGIRLIGLSTKFSREFVKAVQKDLDRDFNEQAYDRKMAEVFSKYSSRQLADMSPAKGRCKVR